MYYNYNVYYKFLLYSYILGRSSLLSRSHGPSLLWDVEASVYDIAILPGVGIIGTCRVEGIQVYDKKSGQKIKHPISDMCEGVIYGVSVGDGGATVAAVEYLGYDPGILHIYTSLNDRWKHHMYNTCEKPQSVACIGDEYFIVGSFNGSIYKYNTRGRLMWEMKLSFCPEFISTDHKNRILVSITDGGCVTVYNEDGVEMFSFPAATDQRKLKPHGLCVDDEDNILVADRDSTSVLLYDHRGQFLKKLVDIDYNPLHVALYRDTHLAVSDVVRLHLYELWWWLFITYCTLD